MHEDVAYDAETLDERVYAQLKAAARSLLDGRRGGVSFTPTSLVHDAYVRLTQADSGPWRSESHFRAAAAKAMRHVLVDRARRRQTDKHGGRWLRVSLTGLAAQPVEVDVALLNEALDELALIDPRAAEVVQMRFMAGMTCEQIAEVLTLSARTIERDWRAARAWLLERLAL